jgi:putative spermidine/putrescine transport system permease protein
MNALSGSARLNARLIAMAAWACYVFLLLPSLIVIPISFGNSRQIEFPPREFSIALYRQFFSDQAWWGSMVQSLFVATTTTVLTLVLAVPAAYALVRSHLPANRLLRGLFMTPMLVPVIVLGLGLYLQFSSWSLLDTTSGLIFSHIMLTTPFVMVAVTSGLQHADRSLETVASIMGASRPVIFLRVLLPQLKTSIAVGALFAFLMSLDEVVVAYFVTGTRSMTLPVKMFSSIRWELTPVLAAVSTLLSLLSLLIAVGIITLQRKTEALS